MITETTNRTKAVRRIQALQLPPVTTREGAFRKITESRMACPVILELLVFKIVPRCLGFKRIQAPDMIFLRNVAPFSDTT